MRKLDFSNIRIVLDRLVNNEVISLVNEHKISMLKLSPEESVHALDSGEVNSDNITFWTIWYESNLMGCGALKELSNEFGEVKTMRTHKNYLRRGVAERMLNHIINESKARGYSKLYLETGTSYEFMPAHKLYEKYRFVDCGPFAEYFEDANSRFMVLDL